MANWKKVLVSGSSAHLTQVTASTATLGTLSGTDITVGSGKTLSGAGTFNVSAGTLTLAADQISGDKVEGGTIAATTISALTTAGITATSNIDIGTFTLTGTRFISDIATGTAPFGVSSTTVVTNLNADKLDGQHGSYYTDFTNMTVDADEISGDKVQGGTIGSTTITTLDGTTLKDFTTISGSAKSTGSFGMVEILTHDVISTGDAFTIRDFKGYKVAEFRSDSATLKAGLTLGLGAKASGERAMTMGSGSDASGSNSVVIGINNLSKEEAVSSVVVGGNSQVWGYQGVILGNECKISGSFPSSSVVIGTQSTGSADYVVAIGYNVHAAASASVAVGKNTVAGGKRSIALGYASASANDSISIGSYSTGSGQQGTAIGYRSISTAANAIGIGYHYKGGGADGAASVAIGTYTDTSGTGALALGYAASASANYSVALGGFYAKSTGTYAMAFGKSTVSGISSVGFNLDQGGSVYSLSRSKTFGIGRGSTEIFYVSGSGPVYALGTITAGGFTTTGTWTMDTSAGGTTGITQVNAGATFTDSDTTLMTAGAIKEKIEDYGYGVGGGDITGVTAGAGLNGGGASGGVTLSVDSSSISAYLSSSAFSKVSGDVNIASTGVATIQANSVALSTDTTGNYVGTVTGGTGITSTGATTGEGIAHSLSVDASQTQITSVGAITTGTWNSGFGQDSQKSITGSWKGELSSSNTTNVGGGVSGSLASTGSFGRVEGTKIEGTLVTAAQTAITSVGTIGTGTWQGTDVGVAYGGTGASSLNNLITMGTHTTGDFVGTITGGTGITSTGNTTGEDTDHSLSVDVAQTQITSLGTINSATSITATDLIGTNIDGIIGADTARAGTFTTLTATGQVNFTGGATITNVTSSNLIVGDAFAFFATGSAGSNLDSGFIVQSGSADLSGSAIYHEKAAERWAVAKGVSSIALAVTPLEYVVTAKALGDDNDPVAGDLEYGVGEMAINDNGTIWIYS